MQKVNISADAGEQPAEQVGEELRALHIDAKHQRTLVVSADRVQVAPKPRPAKHGEDQKNDAQRNNDAKLNSRGDKITRLTVGADARNDNPKLF
ncbi:hypothetical protein SDC9_172830 [bioreactor metagenome]|uniref:Uncharacterized protein n=1 Tax=bioreactor metagenome TaxID=1076179 RepID=A0A645GES7_9ZZZZ